jgi:two-component system alkaline phosphatase synthesis response regulator PhoP
MERCRALHTESAPLVLEREPGMQMQQTTVLVVDDEQGIVDLVRGYLEREGFHVLEAHDGLAAVELARQHAPDVIVLDLMLPGIDGLEVTRQIRTFSDAYLLMLTARVEEIDRIIGLTTGADDYLTKPFSPRELVARIRALLRRPRAALAHPDAHDPVPLPLTIDTLTLDRAAHEVRLAGRRVELTPLEFTLLETLMARPGMVFSRQHLIDAIWGDYYGDEHVVDVHLSNLRRKLDTAGGIAFIETVRGVGYRFKRPQPC